MVRSLAPDIRIDICGWKSKSLIGCIPTSIIEFQEWLHLFSGFSFKAYLENDALLHYKDSCNRFKNSSGRGYIRLLLQLHSFTICGKERTGIARRLCSVEEPACDHKKFLWLDEWETPGSHHHLPPSFAALYRPLFTQKSYMCQIQPLRDKSYLITSSGHGMNIQKNWQ